MDQLVNADRPPPTVGIFRMPRPPVTTPVPRPNCPTRSSGRNKSQHPGPLRVAAKGWCWDGSLTRVRRRPGQPTCRKLSTYWVLAGPPAFKPSAYSTPCSLSFRRRSKRIDTTYTMYTVARVLSSRSQYGRSGIGTFGCRSCRLAKIVIEALNPLPGVHQGWPREAWPCPSR